MDMETERALDKRWAPVSVSRNADSEFKLRTRDPVKAFTYICLGCAPWKTENIEQESDDEDEEDEESIEQKKKDDAGIALKQSTAVRDPDNFETHVYNDFFGYAVMELVENLLVDFDEAAGDWKMYCEDGETVNAVCIAFATMFLTMLATLERNDLFKSDSEVKNIGAIIGLFIRFIVDVEEYGIDWDGYDVKIKAYAAKHDVIIHGLNHRYVESSDETVELPEVSANSNDP
ncbi:hypothetical protein PEX1_055780 [Penicillium expansum]|uniref:Uncharacterized protein n=1 Tax=Penicillium expansum TaxID=27334 RepID=A0A0A2I040_PENEN|nr:hypothetical protein PEX2_052850 [Penicillium expansum]KGO36562.1 hypothetical protein PEXP_104230 [Penicillium expansum]KGO48156.1 hypothetical protein PEX1_055780 [Penicillium expansum]KGO59974.1 hypothetical protein PEX2_052850 [Penicillium expansum]